MSVACLWVFVMFCAAASNQQAEVFLLKLRASSGGCQTLPKQGTLCLHLMKRPCLPRLGFAYVCCQHANFLLRRFRVRALHQRGNEHSSSLLFLMNLPVEASFPVYSDFLTSLSVLHSWKQAVTDACSHLCYVARGIVALPTSVRLAVVLGGRWRTGFRLLSSFISKGKWFPGSECLVWRLLLLYRLAHVFIQDVLSVVQEEQRVFFSKRTVCHWRKDLNPESLGHIKHSAVRLAQQQCHLWEHV